MDNSTQPHPHGAAAPRDRRGRRHRRRRPPAWRARAVGVYRLWRDGGFAIGALLAGTLADPYGLTTAIWAIAALVAVRMYETHPRG